MKPGDARLGDILQEGKHGDVVFVLYPCDIGVIRNGGRGGARDGPSRFLHLMKSMGCVQNPEYSVDLSEMKLSYHEVDLEDLSSSSSSSSSFDSDALEEAHRRLTAVVSEVLKAGGLPFVVGGGNDQSFANWRALRQFHDTDDATIGVINVDAHLDVRALVDGKSNSGTPFRQILEADRKATKLWEFAAQGAQCSQSHADYVVERGGTICWLKDVGMNPVIKFKQILDEQTQCSISGFVSFDLDSIKASDCPGVSCPANIGLSAEDAVEIMRAAGESSNVELVDMSEMNTRIEDYVTPRLAVLMAYNFLLGYSKRMLVQQRATRKQKSYRLRISNLSQLVCVEDIQNQGFRTKEHMSNVNVIENGTILVDAKGRIAYAGPTEGAPTINSSDIEKEMDGRGRSAIPGLCDAHTHSVFAGDRVHEFAMKLAGKTYMEIHESGGGINFTVKHTQQADEGLLYTNLVKRLGSMNRCGTTLAECKSGYGLDTATELKMLRVIDRAHQELQFIDLVGNFCGAHSIPESMSEQEALGVVVNEMIPALAGEQGSGRLTCVRLVDVFVEDGVFGTESAKQIIEAGTRIGLLGNFHGDELTYQGCGELAGELKCRAVSHLEHVSDTGILAMKASHTAAVLLPSTAFVLRISPPPARKLIANEVPVALGSDFNPNAYCYSMPYVMNLACITMKMTVDEALVASTLNAAYSMGMQDTHGSLEIGKHGDILLIDAPRWDHLVYQFGGTPPLFAVIKDGVVKHV